MSPKSSLNIFYIRTRYFRTLLLDVKKKKKNNNIGGKLLAVKGGGDTTVLVSKVVPDKTKILISIYLYYSLNEY